MGKNYKESHGKSHKESDKRKGHMDSTRDMYKKTKAKKKKK